MLGGCVGQPMDSLAPEPARCRSTSTSEMASLVKTPTIVGLSPGEVPPSRLAGKLLPLYSPGASAGEMRMSMFPSL